MDGSKFQFCIPNSSLYSLCLAATLTAHCQCAVRVAIRFLIHSMSSLQDKWAIILVMSEPINYPTLQNTRSQKNPKGKTSSQNLIMSEQIKRTHNSLGRSRLSAQCYKDIGGEKKSREVKRVVIFPLSIWIKVMLEDEVFPSLSSSYSDLLVFLKCGAFQYFLFHSSTLHSNPGSMLCGASGFDTL